MKDWAEALIIATSIISFVFFFSFLIALGGSW